MNNRYLSGENIKPRNSKEAKELIGKLVIYLESRDIDKSGRGYFFPRKGIISAVCRREIAIDSPDNFVTDISKIVEMELVA